MNILIQCGILFGICIVGNSISAITHLPVPGNVFGMVILFILLYTGVLKKVQIQRISKFFLGNMAFFFIPSGVAIIEYYKELEKAIIPFLLIIVFTTFIVMGATGEFAQLMQKICVRSVVYYKTKRNYTFVSKQGNWLYYSYSSKGLFKRFLSGLYKVKSNGTGRQKLTGDIPFCIHIAGKWIYYGCCVDSDFSHYTLYKIMIDGSNRTRIDNVCFNEMLVYEDRIYYTNWPDHALYRVRTDGIQKEKLSGDSCKNINYVNETIFYINCRDDKIYKIEPTGSGRIVVGNNTATQITLVNDWIFYISKSDGHIYRMTTDGSEKAKLVDTSSGLIDADGCWIYCNKNLHIRINGFETNGCILSQINAGRTMSQKQTFNNSGIGIVEDGKCKMLYSNISLF